MELDPRRLLVLAAVARTGGIAPAARALGVSRSAVSQQLAALEQETGLPLLDRAGPRPELTGAGRLLAGTGEQISRQLAAARDQLTDGRQVRGQVVIGASPWVIARLAAGVARLLNHFHPGLEPRFQECDLTTGLRALRVGELDAAVLADDRDTAVPLPPGIRARLMGEDEYRLVVPDSWEPPAAPRELAGRPWIGAPPQSARGRAFARFAAEHGLDPAGAHLAEHPAAVIALMAAGLGAVVAPTFLAAQLPRATTTALPVGGTLITRVLHREGHAAQDLASRLAADALLQAGRNHLEAETAAGRIAQEIHVRTLRDPTE
ncbi:LysR family transcriptional regulator [Kitasatospora viridis]|uniref:Molybdate transport repressor ModE-like protein n=1 Tax=Kitasatospora viridis TaxID=281105 RepID=A0A561S9N2_9ACTN|nr:LysR family transcriptional regulator [Kitasatospora viridis]TWF71515.1 molybdate transport repressor ModE-like protein [Kitasatospora viridis]